MLTWSLVPMKQGLLRGWIALVLVVAMRAGPMTEVVEAVGLAELAGTFDTAKVARVLDAADPLVTDAEERAAAAVLVAMGVLREEALADPDLTARMLRGWGEAPLAEVDGLELALARPVGLLRVGAIVGHEALRGDVELMAALDAAIGEKVLTGYGLRPRHVSAATHPDRTVIYSHSSLAHVKQLVGLMASEGLKGWVFIAPKVAAFVFRDGWGERPAWISELGPGVYVAQGPEMLVHFELARPEDRQRFDELVERHAKKDAADEAGNLIHSWWQPFYYCETEAAAYQPIARITLYGDEVEASLLMLPERREQVRAHFAAAPWEMRVDTIWVNAPFRRFLEGDFK